MKSVISVDDLTDDDIGRLFFRARRYQRSFASTTPLGDAVVMTAFFEPSTRTRLSFEMAAHRLKLSTVSFSPSSSSMRKGESVNESLRNLLAMKPDIVVVRHNESLESLECLAARRHEYAIINAGDGIREHPSQALLDCLTLLDHFGSDSLRSKRILIIGDVAHSRVAHSNIKLMRRLGADITVLAPHELSLEDKRESVRAIVSFADCDGDYDAVMCLRIQKERMKNKYVMSDNHYHGSFGLTAQRLAMLGAGCVILHPGPMNIGVEIDAVVAFGPSSLIERQVTNGVAVRAALIEHCLDRGGLYA